MITCNKCHETKSQDEFYPRNRVCKECTKARVAEYQRGIGKQVANKAKRKYDLTDKGKAALARAKGNYLNSHRDRQRCRWAVKRAVKAGRLVRPQLCELCSCKCRLHAHHPDYGKPLLVEWLCSDCHVQWHKYNTPIYPASQI